MAESNLKEMMIDDIAEDIDEQNTIIDNKAKVEWYLIDSDRTFCKLWNSWITLQIIYTLIVTPTVMVFPEIYQCCNAECDNFDASLFSDDCEIRKSSQQNLNSIEQVLDIIFLIEIILNFLKRTMANKDIGQIATNYIFGTFIFDVIATIPNLIFLQEGLKFFWLKLFRLVHFFRITEPLQFLLSILLHKYSKKRQNDLIVFARLILIVIYISHGMACFWIFLGH